MAQKIATRGAQPVMSADFSAVFNDTMLDVNGAPKTFGSAIGSSVFEVINLPAGAVIVGGELIVETAGVGPTVYTVAVGTAGSPESFLVATDAKATTRAPLTGLGLQANDGKNVRVTVNATVAPATAGKFRLRVEYVIDGRATEVNPN